MDDDLDALSWAVYLPERDRARLREELDGWRATAEAYRDGHGETLSTPVDLVDYLRADEPDDYELPAEVMTKVEESRAAGPGRTGRPVRREHMDAARTEALEEVSGKYTGIYEPGYLDALRSEWPDDDAQAEYEEDSDLRDTPNEATESPTVRREYRRRGGYGSSSKQVSDLDTPPGGPAPGAGHAGDGTDDA